jgi:cyanate permease
MVGKWFQRRLTWAMGVYAVTMSVGFMLAFPAVRALVLASGWRASWSAIGIFLVAVLAPMAWLLVRSTPDDIGEEMDGKDTSAPASRCAYGAA